MDRYNINIDSKILITGTVGFIGFYLFTLLLNKGYRVIGVDKMNDYYDVQLKEDRLSILQQYDNFKFHKIDLKDKQSLDKLFEKYKFDYVINLAAQAGVRYSITNP